MGVLSARVGCDIGKAFVRNQRSTPHENRLEKRVNRSVFALATLGMASICMSNNHDGTTHDSPQGSPQDSPQDYYFTP